MVYQNFEHPVVGKITDGFTIKRARLDFQGHFSSQFDYRVLVDFVGQSGANGTAPTGGQLISPFLVEAYVAYKPFTWLNVKAGQMIVQFSQENITQDRNLDLIERSQVVNALVARKGDAANGLVDSIGNQNGRDIGIQLNGSLSLSKAAILADYYQLGRGSRSRAGHAPATPKAPRPPPPASSRPAMFIVCSWFSRLAQGVGKTIDW